MRLERCPIIRPVAEGTAHRREAFQADAVKMVTTLKALREAPSWTRTIAARCCSRMMRRATVLRDGRRKCAGDPGRSREIRRAQTGDFASNYKGRVLPDSISVIDDPTLKIFEGKTLIGSYDIDDEGVRAAKVPVIQNGELLNYLVGRKPIRDFPESNGHGRAAPGQSPSPNLGNLIVQSKQTLSPDE